MLQLSFDRVKSRLQSNFNFKNRVSMFLDDGYLSAGGGHGHVVQSAAFKEVRKMTLKKQLARRWPLDE